MWVEAVGDDRAGQPTHIYSREIVTPPQITTWLHDDGGFGEGWRQPEAPEQGAEEHDGFIDPCCTSHTKAAGRVRALALGVVQRIETSRTYELVHEVLNVLQYNSTIGGGDWVVRWKRYLYMAPTVRRSPSMVNAWKTMCEDSMSVLHVFESERWSSCQALAGF